MLHTLRWTAHTRGPWRTSNIRIFALLYLLQRTDPLLTNIGCQARKRPEFRTWICIIFKERKQGRFHQGMVWESKVFKAMRIHLLQCRCQVLQGNECLCRWILHGKSKKACSVSHEVICVNASGIFPFRLRLTCKSLHFRHIRVFVLKLVPQFVVCSLQIWSCSF